MAEFKIIETQEQFDEMIKSRLARAEESAREKITAELAEKYADYDEIRSQLEESKVKISELGNQLTEAKAKESGASTQLSELQEKVRKYESDSVKTRIAQEFGLDSQLANRINGSDEAEMREDAKRLKEIVGETRWRTAPLKSTEPEGSDEKEAAIKNMLKTMRGEE